VGDKEVQEGAVAVRERGGKDLGAMLLTDIIDKMQKTIQEKK
jgi:threonyl-tRNA synthetase